MAKSTRKTARLDPKNPTLQGWRAQVKDYGLGLVLGLGGLSLCFASINGKITDDRRLYENLTEIRAQKQRDLNFDGDFAALHAAEARFQEKNLPRPRPRVARVRKQSTAQVRVIRRPQALVRPSGYVAGPRDRQLLQNPRPSTLKKSTGTARGRS